MEKIRNKALADAKLAKQLAQISFVLGTFFLIIHLLIKSEMTIVIGFTYLLIALHFNAIVFVNIIYNAIVYPKLLKMQFSAIGYLFINIPVVLIYIQITIKTI